MKYKAKDLTTFTVVILYNIFMLFYERINHAIIFVAGVTLVFYLYMRFRKKVPFVEYLTYLLCIFVPTSYVSIIGTSYSTLPLTWFNLVTIILFLVSVIRRFHLSFFLFAILLMLSYGLIQLTNSIVFIDGLKQLLTIILFLFAFVIGEFLSKYSKSETIKNLKKFYLLGVFSFSFSVFVQKFLTNSFIFVGYQVEVGNGRQIFAGLFNDYSFATLYVATGAMLLVINYFDKKEVKFSIFVGGILFYLLAILTINSRTGLVALLITFVFYFAKKIVTGNIKVMLFFPLFLMSVPLIIAKVIQSRGGQSFFDSSGRIELLQMAFQVFKQFPFFGVGLGLENLYLKTGMHVPHNLIAQYLVQLGLVGSSIFFLTLFVMFIKYLRFRNDYFWVIFCIVVGSMFIPDIVSSRFFTVLIILAIVEGRRIFSQREVENEKSREINLQ